MASTHKYIPFFLMFCLNKLNLKARPICFGHPDTMMQASEMHTRVTSESLSQTKIINVALHMSDAL